MLHVSACFKFNVYIKAKRKTIALVGIVLGGRCPGVICPGGQLSLEDTVQVNYLEAIFLVGNCLVGNCL